MLFYKKIYLIEKQGDAKRGRNQERQILDPLFYSPTGYYTTTARPGSGLGQEPGTASQSAASELRLTHQPRVQAWQVAAQHAAPQFQPHKLHV